MLQSNVSNTIYHKKNEQHKSAILFFPAVLPEWWQYVRGVISRSQMSSTQLINLTIGTYNSQYEAIEGGNK